MSPPHFVQRGGAGLKNRNLATRLVAPQSRQIASGGGDLRRLFLRLAAISALCCRPAFVGRGAKRPGRGSSCGAADPAEKRFLRPRDPFVESSAKAIGILPPPEILSSPYLASFTEMARMAGDTGVLL